MDTNALKELKDILGNLSDYTLLKADVSLHIGLLPEKSIVTQNMDELIDFLRDIIYDNGFGTQELYGEIYLLKDNIPIWLDRWEYDGAECWNFNTIPTIYI